MITNVFGKVAAWYRENRQYYNFGFVLFYAVWLPFQLFVMFASGHTYFDAWVIFAFNVCFLLYFVKDWRTEKWQHKYHEAVNQSVSSIFDLHESTSQSVRRWQDRLISAHCRRKRVERKLKRCVKALRIESVARRDNELVAYKQRTMLAVAYKALVEGNDEARQTFIECMDSVSKDKAEVKAREIILNDIHSTFQKAVQECALSGELIQTPCDFTPLFHESVGEITTSNNV